MFGNAYQNGPYLEVWDARVDPSKNNFYKQLAKPLPHSTRAFDKEVKSYLQTIQGQAAKLMIPADDTKSLSLHQRYLVLQVFIPVGFQWWVELGMSDLSGLKRRINLTTVQGKQEGKYFSYRYPLEVTKGSWLFLGIDIYSFMEAFKGQTFRALDHIVVGSTCRIRRVFTMKDFLEYQIPNSYWLTHDLPQSLELITFQDQNKSRIMSLDMIHSNSPPQRDVKKSQSGKKDNIRSEITPVKSVIKSDLTPIKRSPKSYNMARSEIIQNARQRLQHLQRQQQLLLQRSQQLQASPRISQKNQIKKKQTISKQEHKRSQQQLKPIFEERQRQRHKQPKAKLPPLERSFQQDEALNIQQSQESVQVQQNVRFSRPFLESKQHIEEEPKPQRKPKSIVSSDVRIEKNVRSKGQLVAFPSTVITKQNSEQVRVGEGRSKKELELIYDQMVGCYYHPETNSYYELKQ